MGQLVTDPTVQPTTTAADIGTGSIGTGNVDVQGTQAALSQQADVLQNVQVHSSTTGQPISGDTFTGTISIETANGTVNLDPSLFENGSLQLNRLENGSIQVFVFNPDALPEGITALEGGLGGPNSPFGGAGFQGNQIYAPGNGGSLPEGTLADVDIYDLDSGQVVGQRNVALSISSGDGTLSLAPSDIARITERHSGTPDAFYQILTENGAYTVEQLQAAGYTVILPSDAEFNNPQAFGNHVAIRNANGEIIGKVPVDVDTPTPTPNDPAKYAITVTPVDTTPVTTPTPTPDTPTTVTTLPFPEPEEPNVPSTRPTDPLTVPSELDLGNLQLVEETRNSGRTFEEDRQITVSRMFDRDTREEVLPNGVVRQIEDTREVIRTDDVYTSNEMIWDESSQSFVARDTFSSTEPYNGPDFSETATFNQSLATSSLSDITTVQTNILSPGSSSITSSYVETPSINGFGAVLTPDGNIDYSGADTTGIVNLLENNDVISWDQPLTDEERRAIIDQATFRNPATSREQTVTTVIDPTIETITRREINEARMTDESFITVTRQGVNGETLYDQEWNLQATRRTVDGGFEIVDVPDVALQSNDVLVVGNVVLTPDSGVLVSYDYEPAGPDGSVETLNAKVIITQDQLRETVGVEQANALIAQAQELQPIDITEDTPAEIRALDFDNNGNVSIEEQRNGRTGLFIVDAQGNHKWLPGDVERLPGALTVTAEGERVVTMENGQRIYIDRVVTAGRTDTIETTNIIAYAPTPTIRTETRANEGSVGYSSENPIPDVSLGSPQRTTDFSADLYGRVIFPFSRSDGSVALQGVGQGNYAVTDDGRLQINALVQANTASPQLGSPSLADVQGQFSASLTASYMLTNPENSEVVPYVFGGVEQIWNAQATTRGTETDAYLQYGNQEFLAASGSRGVDNDPNGDGRTDALNALIGVGVQGRHNNADGGDITWNVSAAPRYTLADTDGYVVAPDSGNFGLTLAGDVQANFNQRFGLTGGVRSNTSFYERDDEYQGDRTRNYFYVGARIGTNPENSIDPSRQVVDGGLFEGREFQVSRIYARGTVFNQEDPTFLANRSRAEELPRVTRQVVAEVIETPPAPGTTTSYLIGYVYIPADELTGPTQTPDGEPAGNVYEFRLPVRGQITDTHREAFVERIDELYNRLDREISRTRTDNAAGALDTSEALNEFGNSLNGELVAGLAVERLAPGVDIQARFADEDIHVTVAQQNQAEVQRLQALQQQYAQFVGQLNQQYPGDLEAQYQALAQATQPGGPLEGVQLNQNNGLLVLWAADGTPLGVISGEAGVGISFDWRVPNHTVRNPQQQITNLQSQGISAQEGIAPNLQELGVTPDQAIGVIPSAYGQDTLFTRPDGTTPVEDGRVPLLNGQVIQIQPGATYTPPQPPVRPQPAASSLGRLDQLFPVAPPNPDAIRQNQEPLRPPLQGIINDN